MVDKLVLLFPRVLRGYLRLAEEKGWSSRAYRKVVDLGIIEPKWGRLYTGGRRSGINKLEIVDVASLGWPRCKSLVRKIWPDLSQFRIYRIDLCVDLWGISAPRFAQNAIIPGVQSVKVLCSRGAWSYYLRAGGQEIVFAYDKARHLRATVNPKAAILDPKDEITRLEAQLKGNAVPFKTLDDIHRYADFNPFARIEFNALRIPHNAGGTTLLAFKGLKHLVQKCGMQAALKTFRSPERAYIKRRFLRPMQSTEILPIAALLRRSTADWLAGRIRFPRGERE